MATYGQRKDTQSQVDEHITDSLGTSAKKTLVVGRDSANNFQDLYVDSSGRIQLTGLVPGQYDYIALSYTGSNLTGVVYKTGGSGGTTVATLTLAYTGSVLDTITKT